MSGTRSHSGPGDAFVLFFQHFIGILVGRVQHPDFEEQIQKTLLRQEFPGLGLEWRNGRQLFLLPLPGTDDLHFCDFAFYHTLGLAGVPEVVVDLRSLYNDCYGSRCNSFRNLRPSILSPGCECVRG